MTRTADSRGTPAAVIGAWTDALNVRVASYVWPRPSQEVKQRYLRAIEPSPDPGDLAVYLQGLLNAWRTLLIVSLLLMGGLAYTGDRLAGNNGNTVGLNVGLFAAGFCLQGELDATLRLNRARRARLLMPALTEHEAERAARLVRQARVNVMGVALQIVGGLIWLALSIGFL